jgi:hypothetical protein
MYQVVTWTDTCFIRRSIVLADKITRFEDYLNKDVKQENRDVEPEVTRPAPKEPVPQETMDIQIEDPFQFLNEQEREEYIRQRELAHQEEERKKQLEIQRQYQERQRREQLRQEQERQRQQEIQRQYQERQRQAQLQQEQERQRQQEIQRQYQERQRQAQLQQQYAQQQYAQEHYREDEDYYEYEEEDDGYEEDSGINKIVMATSIFLGLLVLLFLGLLIKVKVIDPQRALIDPDEEVQQETQVQEEDKAEETAKSIPEGYVEKNDTVEVTAELLNLRTQPNSKSDDTVAAMVPKGTELNRIAVDSSGSWALVEYEGQQLYASMKFLKEK